MCSVGSDMKTSKKKKKFCHTGFDGIVRRILPCVTLVLGTAEYAVSGANHIALIGICGEMAQDSC